MNALRLRDTCPGTHRDMSNGHSGTTGQDRGVSTPVCPGALTQLNEVTS